MLALHGMRVMQELGMLRMSRKKTPESVIAKSTNWVRAEMMAFYALW